MTALKALVEMWRQRADICEAAHRDMALNRRDRAEFAGESRTFGLCANELEQLLTAAPEAQPTEHP